MHENSAADPASTKMSRSPKRRCNVPDNTMNQSRPALLDEHLGDRHVVRGALLGERPHGAAAHLVALGADDDILVFGFDEQVERGLEGARDGHELVERDAAVARLDATQRGGAQEAAGGERVERPAACHPQGPDALANDGVEVGLFLLHAQESMSRAHVASTVEG
jgi:hypothetical protein